MAGAAAWRAGETVASLDRVFAEVNAGRAVEIPTAIGFCMYIKRACVAAVGLFDEATFGRGYGEENDFCLRAARCGWHHVLAADTFVFHVGEVSFGDSAAGRKTQATEIIRQRYPHYEGAVASFVRRDLAYPFRLAATGGRYRAGGRPVILLISHTWGGGVERHIRELLAQASQAARFLRLYPAPAGQVTLTSGDPREAVELTLDVATDFDFLVALLRSFGVSRIHIHHFVGLGLDLHRLARELAG